MSKPLMSKRRLARLASPPPHSKFWRGAGLAGEDLYLKHWREARKLSISALSRMSGISKVTIINAEKGRRIPHRATLISLAHALNCSIYELEAPPPAGLKPVREYQLKVG